MTKAEKEQFTNMQAALDRIEAACRALLVRLDGVESGTLIEGALDAEPTNDLCIDAVPVETQQAQESAVPQEEAQEPQDTPSAVVSTNAPVSAEELAQINEWLVNVSKYLSDEGSLVKGVLKDMGLASLTEIGDDRIKVEDLKARVTKALEDQNA